MFDLPKAIMLRTSRLISVNLAIQRNYNKYDFAGPDKIYSEVDRRRRKPMWLPTAKTKMFRVPKRPVIPMEEVLEIQRLYNNYRTHMKSIRSYLTKVAAEKDVELNQELLNQKEEEDFLRCSEINDKWNAELVKVREARIAIERKERAKQILENITRKEKRDEIIRKKIDECIRMQKKSKFITSETIDEELDKALTNVVNYDSAIDTEGNFYEGRLSETSTTS